MRKNGKLVGLLLIAIVLTLVAVVSIWNGPKANNNNSSPEVSFIWQKPAVSFAELSNSGIVSQEIIVENTDFTRKTIRFKPGTTSETKSQIISDINGKIIENTDNNTVVVKISEESLSEAERELTQSDSVALFETDYAVGLLSIIDWGVARIGANEIWDQSRARGIRVGIIDTGIDRSHPDLANYAGGFDFVNEDADPQDDNGHGTAVAGIVASAQNGVATIGVGPEISILAAKVLNSEGIGYVSDVVEGINWAVTNGASVINLSLGTTYDSSFLKSAVDKAAASGVIVVAAAGNTNGGSLVYPAAYGSVIAVGATDQNDFLASFSAIGSELVAPGVSITAPWIGGGTILISGTSASSPHVAGVAAHLIANNISNVREALRNTAEDLGQAGQDPYFGYGIVNTPAALGFDEEDSEAPRVEFVSPINGQKLASSGRVIVNIKASDNEDVLKVDLVVNGKFVYSSATSPYRWKWDLSTAQSGVYELTAKALDNAGNIGMASIIVEIIADRPTLLPTQAPENIPVEIQDNIPNGNTPSENVPEPAIEKLTTSPSQQGQNQNIPSVISGRRNVRGVSTTSLPLGQRVIPYFKDLLENWF